MTKILFFALSAWFFCTPVSADDDPFADVHKSLKDQTFVVETDDSSSSDSLNRIAGDIDLGFSAPEQSYKSEDHYKPGPFGRQEATDTQNSQNSY